MEEEAYTVQRNFISKIDKNALSIENKINPIYYRAISKCFNIENEAYPDFYKNLAKGLE